MVEPASAAAESINSIAPIRALGSSDAGPPVEDRLSDIDRNQDLVRSNIAHWLVLTLLAMIGTYCLVGLIAASNCHTVQDCKGVSESLTLVRDFLGVGLASITGLVGAVTGFYFGAQAARKGNG